MMIPNPFRFIAAMWRVLWSATVKAEDPIASPEVVAERTRECDGCAYLRGDQCSACKCFVGVKRLFTTEQCPKGFWIR